MYINTTTDYFTRGYVTPTQPHTQSNQLTVDRWVQLEHPQETRHSAPMESSHPSNPS
eukprot:m.142562 g.142562  ORF g.142562 m.142562 type:complete len:57 (-) comp14059_c0_seq4:930-1100(-)